MVHSYAHAHTCSYRSVHGAVHLSMTPTSSAAGQSKVIMEEDSLCNKYLGSVLMVF